MDNPAVYLKLFVTGFTSRSQTAITNLKLLCEEEFGSDYKLEIIDVLEHPELAENEKILATPSLIRTLPPPIRRLIGDLTDKEKVLHSLDVVSGNRNSTPR